MHTLSISLFILFIPLQLLCSDIQERFVDDYFNGKSIGKYVDKNEVRFSERLDITYENITHPFDIYCLHDSVYINTIKRNKIDYTVEHTNIDSIYKQTVIFAEKIRFKRVFIFKNDKLINNINYYSRGWHEIKSKYFIFRISDMNNFNSYCLMEIDRFADSICNILEITGEQRIKLQKEKIYYFLCKNNQEFDSLSEVRSGGYFSRIHHSIVTYQRTHLHEVAHALVTYKLKNQKLLTHLFITEGFAVALGGSSIHGLNNTVQASNDFGFYASRSGHFSPDSLHNLRRFNAYTFIGLSYPLSGLYHKFLFDKIGLKEYLHLYRENSSNEADEINIYKPYKISMDTLYADYIANYKPGVETISGTIIMDTTNPFIELLANNYHLNKGTYLFTPKELPNENFNSLLFSSYFKDREYRKERYLIDAYDKGVKIYDLYLDIIIAIYLNLNFDKETYEIIGTFDTYKIDKNLIHGDLYNDYTFETIY